MEDTGSRLSEACGNKVRQSYQAQQSVFGSRGVGVLKTITQNLTQNY